MTDDIDAGACRRLWAIVAPTAISDAELDPLAPDAAYLRSADFREVCDLAGLDPDAAIERLDRKRLARLAALRAAEAAKITNFRKPAPTRRKVKEPTT